MAEITGDPNITETLHELFSELQAKSLAATSATKYAGTWHQWTQWCRLLHFPEWLPAEREQHSYQLAFFATYCWKFGWGNSKAGNSASTMLAKISHVSWYRRRFCGYGVGLTPGHQLGITGMRREDPPTNPKSPITLQFLKRLHKFLNFDFAQHRVIWGASVLGFFFLLRKSEYLADGAKVHSYAIRRTDVRFLDSNDQEQHELKQVEKVQIRFRGSKTDQFGEGTTRTLARSGLKQCCPVLACWYLVQHHLALDVDADTLLCKVTASLNLQARDLVETIKGAAKDNGYDPDRFGSHSLRSGGATALFNAGFDSLAVKLFGRWRSNAVERYTRIDSRLTARMAYEMVATRSLQRFQGGSSTPHPGSGGAAMN